MVKYLITNDTPLQASQVSYIRTIRRTPIFLPNFLGEVHLIVRKIWYPLFIAKKPDIDLAFLRAQRSK